MDPKEKIKQIKEAIGNFITPEETVVSEYQETEQFLAENLPSDEPTADEYLAAYQKINALRNSKHPRRQQEHVELAMLIERGLPFSTKGFNLLAFQIYSEVKNGFSREQSLVDGAVFLDFDQWQYGYPSFRLWKMIKQEGQTEEEKEAVDRIVWNLLMYSDELHTQLRDEYRTKKEVERIEKEEKAKAKKPLPILPKIVRKNAQKIADEVVYNQPNALEDLGNTVERFKNTRTYFESMRRIMRYPRDLFINFEEKVDFWMSREGEIILSHLQTSNRKDFQDIYYNILGGLTQVAETKQDHVMVGQIGVRHALRLSRLDPFAKDFTDIEYWRGINLPSKAGKKDSPIKLPRKSDGQEKSGFAILGNLLRTNNPTDAKIYKRTMQAFLEYIEKNRLDISDYEVTRNFFKTQYTFDLIFNLPEGEKELEKEDSSFNFVLRKYLWLKYGPEYTQENPSSFEIKLWKLQRNILLKGIRVFEDLFRIQKEKGQDDYEIHRDFYQEAKSDLEEQYTQSGWHLIMFTTRNYGELRNIFAKSFEKFRIEFGAEDERIFYLSVLLGTLDFALVMKHRDNLRKVGASTMRYLHGTKIPTAFQEVSDKAEAELQRWKFRKDKTDPKNPRLVFDNNLINSLKNLSITWGRGYGVSVFLEQGGLRVKNPLHTMGEEKEIKKGEQVTKERPNKGGKDEVIIPWDIIAKATPQFDYINWADSLLKLVGQYRATMGRRDFDWLSDITAKGPAVIRFEAAGSDRSYELPPLPNAREVAKLLKEIANQMIIAETPHPKDILKKLE